MLWYRKEFKLPSLWKGSACGSTEGPFRNTTVWINGALAAQHDCGYTPFRVRLDNLTSVAYGAKSTVAVYVDPDNGDLGGRESGSGWWYEGGGLYRLNHLVRASPVHIEQDGLFAYSNVSLANAGDAASATVHASAVVNTGAAAADVCVSFDRRARRRGRRAAAARRAASTAPAPPPSRATIAVAAPRLWSSASPTLYSVSAAVGACGGDDADRSAPAYRSSSAAAADALTVPHGFRTLRYDADDGFFLNEEHFKVRPRNWRDPVQSRSPVCSARCAASATTRTSPSSGWRRCRASTSSARRRRAPWAATAGARVTTRPTAACWRSTTAWGSPSWTRTVRIT